MLEDIQNFNNWCIVDSAVPKRKRFLARKIHKLKKILKFSSKSLAKMTLEESQNAENEREIRENYVNEMRERELGAAQAYRYEGDAPTNVVSENCWDNWDACYVCAGNVCGCRPRRPSNSVCYVFMPGQLEPVPVKLRNARIPGGVMWISYRPDVDIRAASDRYSHTSSQTPQAQRPILV